MEKSYITVLDAESYMVLMDCIRESHVVAVDTETTGVNPRKDKIIGASFTTSIGNGFYIPTLKYNPDTDTLEELYTRGVSNRKLLYNIFNILRQQEKKLIMHNGSFDTGIIMHDYGIDLLPYLWIETTLAVHTVNEEGAFSFGKPFALKSIAKMYQQELGLDVEEEANKEQIELKESILKNNGSTTKSNYQIYKADLDILSKYACADTDLTYRLGYLFVKKIISEGLKEFFFDEEVMPVYKEVTVPMERKGVTLDIPLIERTKKEITDILQDIKDDIVSQLVSYKEVRHWIFTQCYINKFPPKNRGRYAKLFCIKKEIPLPLDAKGEPRLLKKSIESLEDSPYKRFLLGEENHGVPEIELIEISLMLWKELNNGYTVNIQSKKHLSEICFDFLNIKHLSETASGTPQFDDTFIESISQNYSWAYKLRTFNRLSKIKSTYVDRLLEQNEDGIFYPYFKQHGTVTGRYGSDLQQLPKPKEEGEDDPVVVEYNNRIRAFFISRKGFDFIDSDYESLEPHIFASISNDINLQEIFNRGHDFYSTVAIRTEKLQNVSADKKADNYLKKVDGSKRQKAKAYALGIAYGMSGYALAKSLNVSKKEGEQLRSAYLEGFPGVAKWIEESHKNFEETGIIKNKVGRIRHLTKAKSVFDRYGKKIFDFNFKRNLVSRLGQDKVLEYYRDLKNGYNSSLNFQIQSLAASVVNRSALMINRFLKNNNYEGQVVAQIHDQLIIEIRDTDTYNIIKDIQRIMETTTELKGVTLKSPPEVSKNFRDGH